MRYRIKKIFQLVKNFGLVFTVKYIFLYIKKDKSKYIANIESFFVKEMSNIIGECRKTGSGERINKTLWVCWWQGEEQMPQLIKICYNNLKRNVGTEYNLQLITYENYRNYVSIPDIIIDKLNNNIIPITQFSDILRNGLLYQNGGTWIDASIFCTENFTQELMNKFDFWSIKLNYIDRSNYGQLISECKWSSFLMSGAKGNVINGFVFKTMCSYFTKYDICLDYFMQNILIRVAYHNIKKVKEIIDRIEPSNPCLYKLYQYMDSAFDVQLWKEMKINTYFFKLTQKREYKNYAGNCNTFYNYIANGENIE